MDQVLKAIPHRPPFLFVDNIVELTGEKIKTTKYISQDEPFFKGHYPGMPIMPGVLLCEAIFQSGAILLSHISGDDGSHNVPVLARIGNAKFKNIVRPNALLEIEAELVETLGNAFFLKGRVSVAGKVAVMVEFACSMTTPEP